MRIAGRFSNDRLELTQLNARAGNGTVQAQGSIGLAADAGFVKALGAAVDRVNAGLSVTEKVRRFALADAPFTK